MSKIDIQLNGSEIVGSITFSTSPYASGRTASGVRICIPASVRFWPPQSSQTSLLLENLAVTVFAQASDGEKEIGNARYSETLTTANMDRPIQFMFDLGLAAIAFYERLRNGAEPKFRFHVSGAIRFLFSSGHAHHQIASTASPFHADCHVQYSRDSWTGTLRDLKVRDCILVEIPFPSDPPNEWEAVWQALRDARDSFESGGSTGWKNCVSSVRLALEKWRDFEPENQGLGWKRPDKIDLESRTKEQRMDAVRWHLMQCAHQGPHTTSEGWTRDDALLALATLTAMIAARKP
jgi:hypothetical protein